KYRYCKDQRHIPLYRAAWKNNFLMVVCLLENGPKFEDQSEYEKEIVMEASKEIQQLFKKYTDAKLVQIPKEANTEAQTLAVFNTDAAGMETKISQEPAPVPAPVLNMYPNVKTDSGVAT